MTIYVIFALAVAYAFAQLTLVILVLTVEAWLSGRDKRKAAAVTAETEEVVQPAS